MINSSNSYEKAMARLAEIRAENEIIAEKRKKDVYLSYPEIKEIDSKLRSLIGKIISVALDKNSAGLIAEIKRESEALCDRKARILREAGLGEDYLDGVYTCRFCRDTGYLSDGRSCSCLKQLLEEEKAKSLRLSGIDLAANGFDSFRLEYYPPEHRDRMENILNVCKKYASGFSRKSINLIFRGGTGTGKTFLASLIAASVSESGFDAMYLTLAEHIALNNKKKY
ncbi:MAG: hypothetical protein MJ067_05900, partial [Oscillospiraceae bacterium]|nr:hypothetical protein [Oscillospiraceae bacterium]